MITAMKDDVRELPTEAQDEVLKEINHGALWSIRPEMHDAAKAINDHFRRASSIAPRDRDLGEFLSSVDAAHDDVHLQSLWTQGIAACVAAELPAAESVLDCDKLYLFREFVTRIYHDSLMNLR